MIGDLISVIQADYTRAVSKRKATCPDCEGACFTVHGDDDRLSNCATCDNQGWIETDEYDFADIPEDMRHFVQGFKVGPRGKILPDLRSKDKAATELIKVIGAGWTTPFKRDAYGADSPADAPAVDPLSKEGIINAYQRIAVDADPTLALAALREISKLKGYLTEEDESTDKQALDMGDVQSLFAALLTQKGHKLPPPRATDVVDSDTTAADTLDESLEKGL